MNQLFKIAILLFFGLITQTGRAQQVNLEISDSLGLPVSYAHISYKSLSKTSIWKDLYTDQNGELKLELYSSIDLKISALGFKPYRSIITYTQTNQAIKIILQQDIIELDEIVITGQIGETSLDDAVQTIKIITKEQIQNQGAVTLKDVLATQQNVQLTQDLVLGTSMSLLGVSGQNVKIMIDGVAVIGRQSGNIDLSQISLSDVEKIEIVEGPMSVNYGSDALGGTVNIITKKGAQDSIYIEPKVYYETIGLSSLGIDAGIHIKNSCLKVFGGRNFFNGWAEVDTSRNKDWKPKEQYNIGADYIYYTKKSEIRFKTHFFDEFILNRGNAREPFYIQAFDDEYKTKRVSNSIHLERPIKNYGQLNLVAGYNFYQRKKNTYVTDLTTLESQLSSDASAQDTSNFDLWMSRASYNVRPDSSIINYQIGYDIQRESGTGQRVLDEKQSIINLAIFANTELELGKYIVLRPGLRYAYNSAYKAPLSPSLNLKISKEQWTLRTSYARGFRAPSLKDLYFNFVDVNHNIQGNPDLKAEYSNNYQASLTHKEELKNGSELKFVLGGFYNDMTNLITLAQVPGTTEFTYQNIEIYQTKGIQSQNTFKSKNTTISLGVSYTGRYNVVSNETTTDRFSYAPEYTLSVSHLFDKPQITASLFAKHQGKQLGFFLDDDESVIRSSIDAFTYSDFSLNKSFFKKKFSLVIGVKNILNIKSINSVSEGSAHNSSTTSTPISYGRTFFTALSFKLSK